MQKRRLSRSRRPGNSDKFSLNDFKRHPIQGFHHALTASRVPIHSTDIFKFHYWYHTFCPSTTPLFISTSSSPSNPISPLCRCPPGSSTSPSPTASIGSTSTPFASSTVSAASPFIPTLNILISSSLNILTLTENTVAPASDS